MSSSSGGKKTKEVGWKPLLAGGLSGAAEAVIMYPTEFVKTQLQLAESRSGATPLYRGPLDCAVQTIKTRGPLGLYNGVSTLIVGSFFKAGVRFFTFDKIQHAIAGTDKKPPAWKTMTAGLCAGVAEAVIAVTPTETIKTKLIHDRNQPVPRYRGLLHGVKLMVQEEGLAGIYRGVVPTMLKQGCNQASRFVVYKGIMDMLQPQLVLAASASSDKAAMGAGKPVAWKTLLAGGVAGFVSVYVTMPFDVVKTRMQGLRRTDYTGSLDCFSKIFRNEGVLAFWRGTTPRLGRVMCSSSIIFTFYEQLMRVFNQIAPAA